MLSQKRKQAEKDVYNYTYKKNQNRPSFGTFFDKELENTMKGYSYYPKRIELAEKYLTNKHVLVLGASRRDIDFVSQFTKKITAIDISEKMVEHITERYPFVDAFVADAEHLSKIKKKFDVIFCKAILHHLQPFDSVIKQSHKILKSKGILFIASEPGALNPFAAVGRILMPSKEHTPGEKPFVFSYYDRVIAEYYETEFVNYYFIVSLLLVVLPTRIAWTRPICKALLIPTVKIEMFVMKLPLVKELAWLTMGVYRKKKI